MVLFSKRSTTFIVMVYMITASGHISLARPKPSHHAKNGFYNTSGGAAPGFLSILKWRLSKLFTTNAEHSLLKNYEPELGTPKPGASKVTWIGH